MTILSHCDHGYTLYKDVGIVHRHYHAGNLAYVEYQRHMWTKFGAIGQLGLQGF